IGFTTYTSGGKAVIQTEVATVGAAGTAGASGTNPGGNGGTVTLVNGGVALANAAPSTAADSVSLHKSRPTDSRFDFGSDSRFRLTVAYTTDADQEILTICGSEAAHSYGFILDDGVLSGMAQTASGSRSKVTIIPSITTDIFYVLDARFFPETGKCLFYVDGVLKGSVSSNLPSTNNTILWSAAVLTDNTTQKAMKMWDIEIMQKRFK
ncbi:hypothetical protein LCGC14_2349270, partial [marine sediment metagenome]